MTDDEVPAYLQRLLDTSTPALSTDGNDHPLQEGINPEDDPDATPPDERDTEPTPLLPSQVRYLVFSGGGAKALAYLGVLAALGDYGFLVNPARRDSGSTGDGATTSSPSGGNPPDDYFLDPERVAGVAGSSAGAITAGLMAGRVGLNETYELLTSEWNVKQFFDRAELSTVEYPRLDGVEETNRPKRERNLVAALMGPIDASKTGLKNYRRSFLDYLGESSGFEETVGEAADSMRTIDQWMDANASGRQVTDPAWWLGAVIQNKETGLPPEVVRRVFQTGQFPLYLAQLVFHHGLFSGGYARGYVDAAIRAGLEKWGGDPGPDITFASLAARSSIDLVVTGADLESGSLGTFSATETPEMPVADAIRLSMAIPFVYRPTADEAGPRPGTWVDGGLVNNFPLHAFEPPEQSVSPTVLGFRLESPTDEIDSVGGFVGSVMDSLLTRTTNNQIHSDREASQVVGVPTGGLQTLGFTPDEDVLDEAMKDAAQAVYEYFGQHPDTAEADAERAVEQRVYGDRSSSLSSLLSSIWGGESSDDTGSSDDDEESPSGGERQPDRPWWVSDTSPEFPDLPKRDPSIDRYSKSYVLRLFRSEMLEIIKSGRSDAESWEPHPLAFLLDPQVLRGNVDPPPDDPSDLVDPKANPETYVDGVSYWPPMTPGELDDWYFVQNRNRRVSVDAGHLVPRDYLEKDPYEYERLAFEDTYLNRIREKREEDKGAIPKKWAVEIDGVPVEIETARRLEIDEDLEQADYFEMSDEEQAQFRQRHFPIDYEFPDWKPFGGVLGGLPKGTVDRKLSNDEWTAGWIYVRGYDARRISELEPEFQ